RHRVLRPRPGHHRELKHPPNRGDPPVHRGRHRAAAGTQPDHRLARRTHRTLLPIQVVEQVHRHHIGQPGIPPSQKPQEVQQVIGVSPHRSRRERPRPQMREEPVDQLTVRAAPLNPVTLAGPHDTLTHRPSPQGHLGRVWPPPLPKSGISGNPGVSPGRGPVNRDLLLHHPEEGRHANDYAILDELSATLLAFTSRCNQNATRSTGNSPPATSPPCSAESAHTIKPTTPGSKPT